MNYDNLTIVDYEEADLLEILSIENESFPSPWTAGLFQGETKNPISRILVGRTTGERGKSVAGYVVFWNVADETHLHHIAVRKDLRKRGIASRMVSSMIHDCINQGSRFITLEVRRSNLSAQKLYENFGFSVRGVRPGYYNDTGDDALIMSLELDRNIRNDDPPAVALGEEHEERS